MLSVNKNLADCERRHNPVLSCVYNYIEPIILLQIRFNARCRQTVWYSNADSGIPGIIVGYT